MLLVDGSSSGMTLRLGSNVAAKANMWSDNQMLESYHPSRTSSLFGVNIFQ